MLTKAEKNKWIKALRSGEYKQGTGELKTSRGAYCCLGVLAKAVVWKRLPEHYRSTDLNGLSELPSDILDAKVQETYIDMNDAVPTPKSFREIADHIEVNLKTKD